MDNALKGIILVAFTVAVEKAQERARDARKTYEAVEEHTRNMDSIHVFQMYPVGARPYNYLQAYREAEAEASRIRRRLDDFERTLHVEPPAIPAPFQGWCGRDGCIACYMYPSGVLCS